MAATLGYFESDILVLFLGGVLGLLLGNAFVLLQNKVLVLCV
jgi:uncharacterized protein involved in exopolysaccharide biosynthesis